MLKLKNKIRAMFDIIPTGSEDLDLKTLVETVETVETAPSSQARPVQPLQVLPGNKSEAQPQTEHGGGLDDLMSQILEGGEITPKEEIETLMADVNDPVVELARVGVVIGKTGRWRGDLRTKEGITETELPVIDKNKTWHHSRKTQDDFHKEVLAKIMEPVSPRVVATLASAPATKTTQIGAQIEARPRLSRSHLDSINRQDLFKQVLPVNEVKGKIIAEQVVSFYQNPVKPELKMALLPEMSRSEVLPQKKSINFVDPPKKRRTGWWLSLIIIIGVASYGFTLKNEVIQGGISAFNSLEEAGESLKSLNFSEASENFGKSYQDFERASQTMNFMGAGLAGIFSDLPGAGKIKSAKDMVEAGKLIAQSGKEMSRAMDSLAHTGSILNPADKNKVKPRKIISGIKDALLLSSTNFQKAKALIAGIDESVIPEEKRADFGDFKDKLPLLEEYLGNAVEYTEFLEAIVGVDEPKKYLLLFNNSSELRPTGGFPGTYGVVSFSGGGLADFFVDDVYNLDGQLTRNIIPPEQLQHITPNWGMRDSSWFIDFPTSAKKAISFFSTEAGYGVDGVIALNPDIVSGILEVVGPIKMSGYDLTLTAGNFLESIQEEVEYGDNRVQPKKVVVDFAPRFLEKLYSADSEKWMKIFDVLMTGLDEKDILFYFNDKESENFSIKEGFGGEVKNVSGDYLMVNFTNVKGSKTDAVTDSSIEIDNRFEDGKVIHKVTLTRNHKGGDHEHGFYNRQNPAYVRVLVPDDAELLSISGNDRPNFKPIVNYGFDGSFEKDRDLALFESGFSADKFPGVEKFKESGKKGIGFWMITDPRTVKKIEFEYSVPLTGKTCLTGLACYDYSFYFQKQPGLDWKNFIFKLRGDKVKEIIPVMNNIGSLYLFDEELRKDFELKVKFKQ